MYIRVHAPVEAFSCPMIKPPLPHGGAMDGEHPPSNSPPTPAIGRDPSTGQPVDISGPPDMSALHELSQGQHAERVCPDVESASSPCWTILEREVLQIVKPSQGESAPSRQPKDRRTVDRTLQNRGRGPSSTVRLFLVCMHTSFLPFLIDVQ